MGWASRPSSRRKRESRVFGLHPNDGRDAREYEQLNDKVHRGQRQLLAPYGATNPTEFLAVAAELFFERPRAMKQQYPELYAELARFYGRDDFAV